jgi:hypothetical protein
MASFNKLIKDTTGASGVEKVRSNLASKNQFMAAQDVQRVQSRYLKDIESGAAVQSAEVARVLKGESGLDGLLKRFESSSGLSRKEIRERGGNYYAANSYDSVSAVTEMGEQNKASDLVVVVNLYDSSNLDNSKRVGYNVVDLLDNIYTQLKKKHQVPGVPTYSNLQNGDDSYLTKNSVDPTQSNNKYDAKTSKLFTSSNVKDIRDFAKKALLPYVTAFFRAFELSDEMIHAAIDARTDTNTKNPLNSPVLPVNTSAGIMVRMGRPELYESMKLVALGSPMIADTLDVFKMATSRIGGAQEGGKKKRSSKKRSSSRKMRGGDDQQVQEVQPMEGGKKKRSSSKKHGGAKKRSSKKRSSAKRHGGAMEGGKKKGSSKKRSSAKRHGGAMDGGKKKRSSKKRSSSKKHGGAKRRSSKKRSSGRKH